MMEASQVTTQHCIYHISKLYSQYKKAELIKKISSERLNLDPSVNSVYQTISNLQSSTNVHHSVVDLQIRALISCLNERISCLASYRDEETKVLNILAVWRDLASLDSVLLSLLQHKERNRSDKKSKDLQGLPDVNTMEDYLWAFVKNCLGRTLPAFRRRTDHLLAQCVEGIVKKKIADFLGDNSEYYCSASGRMQFPLPLCYACSVQSVMSPNDHSTKKEADLAEVISKATIASFEEAKVRLAASFFVDFDRPYNSLLEHSLQAILSSFLEQRVKIDDLGLQRLYQLLLFYKSLPIHQLASWRKAKAIFELLKCELFNSSGQMRIKRSYLKSSKHSLPPNSEINLLSEEEIFLWLHLAQSKEKDGVISRLLLYRKKRKGAVFAMMEL